ncbi:MAG: PaaI family thioesterase [Spirochaetota bacterium]|nr:MAG: PaaI family thioesterase [Spirochaetota bacterium]
MQIDYSNNYQGCFVCGKENKQGLSLDFFHDKEKQEVKTVWKPSPYMQGFKGVVHGGFISMVLDEVMAKVCLFIGKPALTVRIEVRFKQPVLVNEEVMVRGRCIGIRGKRLELEAQCTGIDGEEKALAEAVFLCV